MPGCQFKHGIQIPLGVEQAIKLDEANGNTARQDAIEKEMLQLIRLKCFDFKPSNCIIRAKKFRIGNFG
jgi:hypothetical protein